MGAPLAAWCSVALWGLGSGSDLLCRCFYEVPSASTTRKHYKKCHPELYQARLNQPGARGKQGFHKDSKLVKAGKYFELLKATKQDVSPSSLCLCHCPSSNSSSKSQ